MKLLADLRFPGWRLRSPNETRGRHHRTISAWNIPPAGLQIAFQADDALVHGPHARRKVTVYRHGPRALDRDNLYASIKPAVDRLKTLHFKGGNTVPGYFWDDSETFIDLKAENEAGDWEVHVLISV